MAELTDIDGIGDHLAERLKKEGITVESLARMSDADAATVNEKLQLRNRIVSREWREQAREIIGMDAAEFDHPRDSKPAAPVHPRKMTEWGQPIPDNQRPQWGEPVDPDDPDGEIADQLKVSPRKSELDPLEKTLMATLSNAPQPKRGSKHKLDRRKKFSTISGQYYGASFMQDDKYYDIEGNEVDIPE